MSHKTGNNRHVVQTILYQLSCHIRLETTVSSSNHTLSTVMSHKTGNKRHLVSTTLYQLSCRTRLETTDTLLKPHTINCHVVQVWKQAITLFQPHTINCHAIQDWQQQTPCSNHTLSIVMSYKNSNRHLVSTTHYQLSLHTKLETTDTIFKPHYQIAMSEDQLHNVYLRQP